MSALEREILEKFHMLQPDEKLRVRALIEQETASVFDYAAWRRDIEALRNEISAGQTRSPAADVIDILRDIRDGEDE